MPNVADPQDILIVRNIDEACDDVDSEEEWSHKNYFQVRYAGHPHRIAPGQTMFMPRYLAEHFAKKLADHILQKRADDMDQPFLPANKKEREKVISQIIVGVENWYLGSAEPEKSEGEEIAAKVDAMNAKKEKEEVIDIGKEDEVKVGSPQMPRIKDTDTTDNKATSIFDDTKPNPPRPELIKECSKLGIDFSFKDTNEQLIEKIKAF